MPSDESTTELERTKSRLKAMMIALPFIVALVYYELLRPELGSVLAGGGALFLLALVGAMTYKRLRSDW